MSNAEEEQDRTLKNIEVGPRLSEPKSTVHASFLVR